MNCTCAENQSCTQMCDRYTDNEEKEKANNT